MLGSTCTRCPRTFNIPSIWTSNSRMFGLSSSSRRPASSFLHLVPAFAPARQFRGILEPFPPTTRRLPGEPGERLAPTRNHRLAGTGSTQGQCRSRKEHSLLLYRLVHPHPSRQHEGLSSRRPLFGGIFLPSSLRASNCDGAHVCTHFQRFPLERRLDRCHRNPNEGLLLDPSPGLFGGHFLLPRQSPDSGSRGSSGCGKHSP